MTHDGKIFIIDIILERVKDKVELREYVEHGDSNIIADAKLENAYNTLVFRTNDVKFFWVPNVVTGIQALPKPTAFKSIPRFKALRSSSRKKPSNNPDEVNSVNAKATNVDLTPNLEFVILPKQDSQSKKIELFAADYQEGFHLVKENVSHIYYRLQRELVDDVEEETDSEGEEDGAGSAAKRFGFVKFMAFNANKDMIAMYCDPETAG